MIGSLSGLHRTPLLERVIELKGREEAVALAPVGAETSFAFCLELMSQTAALVFPHHRLVRLRRGLFSTHPALSSTTPILCQARRVGAELHVSLQQPREGGEPIAIASGLIELADSPREAPTVLNPEEWSLDRRGKSLNGSALYAAADVQVAAGTHRVVQWATTRGLGHLIGGLGERGPHFGVLSPSTPLASCPGVVEGLQQLTEWQWYALAGEGGRVQAVDRIEWYRIPRADEGLLGTITCRGSVAGAPCFDATAFGVDRKPALELHGVRLAPRSILLERSIVPRVEWQSFVRLLEAPAAQ